MRFFEHQRQARAQSRRLSLVFAAIILLQLLLVNAALLLPFAVVALVLHIPLAQIGRITPQYFFAVNTAVALFYILGGWWLESSRLADGGVALAKRLGARPAQRLENNRGLASSNAAELQFTNIVQEMAIAANMRTPAAFVLPQDASINAFAAGWDASDSVICVTQGALEHLTRAELTGLVAHEFSHIYEGDTRLNMRLAGMVLGLELLHNLGTAMTEGSDRKLDALDAPGVLLGSVLRGVGWLGWTAARMMKAAISREREFLADARAVQYTRQKDGLGATLRKIAWQQDSLGLRFGSHHPAVQHMLLVGEESLSTSRLLQTHPPIAERIKRIYGHSMPPLNAQAGTAKAGWKNPFAASQPLPFARPTTTGDRP